MKDIVKLYIKEQEELKKYQALRPELVNPKRNYSYQEILKRIGIDIDFGFLPQGYLNCYHQDFVVEEIGRDGQISTIEPGNSTLPEPEGKKTLYADLVKVGLSTLEAVASLAENLGLELKKINYAGIKDKVAITSQKISFNGIDWQKLKGLKVDGLFLKNYSWGKGVIEKGKLSGNQFIITVRTPVTLGQGWLDQALDRVKDGFYNFYYLQRFGSPRLLSHKLGKLILEQDYQAVIKTFLTEVGVQDVPLLNQLRQKVKNNFGNWPACEEIFSLLPYTFRLELEIIRYLKNKPDDYLGVLKIKTIIEQSTLWVYAYASYLFNLHLSGLINQQKDLPKELPLLLNPKYPTVKTYADKLAEDKIKDLNKSLINIFGRSMILEKNVCLTKVPVKILGAKIIEKAVVIAFELPPGAYATTFLTHLFALYRGLPLPEWLSKTKYDSKNILGLGSVKKTEAVLGEYMFSHVVEE